MKRHKVSRQILNALKVGTEDNPQPLPPQIVLLAAKELGIVPTHVQDWKGVSSADLWNRTIDVLEQLYPGFRGFQIKYADGRIG